MSEIKLTNSNFEAEVLNSDKPVLVDFWAEWCGPCQMLAPTVAEIAEEYADSVKVGKVNVDEEPEIAAAYSIMSIPTVLLFRDGKIVDTSIGFVPKQSLVNMFDK
ncbi:MAG: thioredoxin [Ruminococcus sp.]|nr:thioredoxin [Ruminococcus sp.]